MKRTAAILLIVVLAFALAGCGGKKEETGIPSSVATVDGKSVSGTTYFQSLSSAFGRQVLPMLIEGQVMLNWAEKEGVPVTDEQINKQIDVLKRDGSYDAQVENLGSDQAVKDRLREYQARINLGEKFNKFTDAELKAMYDDPNNHRRYVHGPRKLVTVIVSSDPKKIQEAEKAIKDGTDFDAAAIKYSDPQFVMGGPAKLPVESGQGPEGLWKAADATKKDEVSKPFTFELGQFGKMNAILKVTGDQPKADLSFDKVKDELKSMAALQKTADPSFQKKFEEQKKKADIKIELPQYKYLVDQIKNPAPQMGMPMMPPSAGKGGKAPAAPPAK